MADPSPRRADSTVSGQPAIRARCLVKVLCRGPHRSGKSTLLHLVGALESATAGSLAVGGPADTMQLSLATMRAVYGIANDSEMAVKARSPGARAAVGREIDRLLRRDYPSSIAFGALAAVLPAQRAARLDPIRAISYQ